MQKPVRTNKPLVIAVSSRVLFDAEQSHDVFAAAGPDDFIADETESTLDPLLTGVGFQFIRRIHELGERSGVPIEIVVISRRDPASGARILRSLAHHKLNKVKGCFTNGVDDITPYLAAFGSNLFLSRDQRDVQRAIDVGVPAAVMAGSTSIEDGEELRIAFDGDAVLFSAEAEIFFQGNGLPAFLEREASHSTVPLEMGPFLPFALALRDIQAQSEKRLIRVALVTARQGAASERAIRSLMSWGVNVDEAHFVGSTPKINILSAFRPHVFFDDGKHHIDLASTKIASGLVPWRSGSIAS